MKFEAKFVQDTSVDQHLVTETQVPIGTHVLIPTKSKFWHILLA